MVSRRDFIALVLRTPPTTAAGTPYDIDILPREAWAVDRPQLGLPGVEDARFLLVHHSASTNSYVEDEVPGLLQGFYDIHTGPERGWVDLAYNFLIDRFGRVWEGRDGSVEEAVVADATGGNQGFSQLACLIGDFTTETPTSEAVESLTRLLAWMADRHGIDTSPGARVSFVSRGSNLWDAGVRVETPTIAGHRDMSITACPGDAFYPFLIEELGSNVELLRQRLRPRETTTTSAVLQPTEMPPSSRPMTNTTALQSSASQPIAIAHEKARGDRSWVRGIVATALLGLLAVLLRRIANNQPSELDQD